MGSVSDSAWEHCHRTLLWVHVLFRVTLVMETTPARTEQRPSHLSAPPSTNTPLRSARQPFRPHGPPLATAILECSQQRISEQTEPLLLESTRWEGEEWTLYRRTSRIGVGGGQAGRLPSTLV